MIQTPHFYKRQEARTIIDKFLKKKTILSPLSISVTESFQDDFTTVDFSYEHCGDTNTIVTIKDSKGKGFIDGLFRGLGKHYSNEYQSLSKINLTEFSVNPIMSSSKKSFGTDSQANVSFRICLENRGMADFQHKSRSIVYSGFSASLSTFQFYINCERAFHKIQDVLTNAKNRSRGDIVQSCMYDLSKLTEVNTYEKREKY